MYVVSMMSELGFETAKFATLDRATNAMAESIKAARGDGEQGKLIDSYLGTDSAFAIIEFPDITISWVLGQAD